MDATLTIPPLTVETASLEVVEVDIYRDVHKGIRTELFGVTTAAGRVDPADCAGVAAVSDRWSSLVHLLVGHAEHEDAFVQPVIERYRPEFAAVIAEDHPRLEAQMAALELLADRTVDAPAGDRVLFTHRLYLGLASFTAEYLRHQEFEETQVMPALSAEIGAAELRALDDAIVASLSPEEMMLSLPLMLAAMNVENRVELLSAIHSSAPPEAFAGVLSILESVVSPGDYRAVATRLGVG